MAEEGLLLSQESVRKIAELVRKVNGEPFNERSRTSQGGFAQSPTVHVIEVTSTTSSGGLFPARIKETANAGSTWSNGPTIWYRPLNSETPSLSNYVARFVGFHTDNVAVFMPAGSMGGAGGGTPMSLMAPGGRLSLSTTDAAPAADQTAKTTVFYHPYIGDSIALLVAGSWTDVPIPSGGASVGVPGVANTNFDVFAQGDTGFVVLETVSWTNNTTRATAIIRFEGVLVKSGDEARRYVGTCRCTPTAGNSEDSASRRYCWNFYNRVPRRLALTGVTGVLSDTGFQAFGAVNAVIGIADTLVELTASVTYADQPSAGVVELTAGIGIDTILTNGATLSQRTSTGDGPFWASSSAFLRHHPAIGGRTYNLLARTFNGATVAIGSGGDDISGLTGSVLA